MRNVAIIIPKLNEGGAERCVSNLSVALASYYNLYLVLYNADNITYHYSGTLINLNLEKGQNWLSRVLVCVRRWFAIRKFKKKYKIDVSISFMPGPNFLNIITSRGERLITSIRNCTSKESYNWIHKLMIHYACRQSDAIVSLSEMVKVDLHEHYGVPLEKIVTIYNHVNPEFLSQKEENCELPLSMDNSKPYIVSMGRMCTQKGQWHLIRAFRKVLEICPELNLIILGDGELRQALTDLMHELQLENKILMPGYVIDTHRYLKNCEMFVFPSLYEGLGNAILEAMAFGLPIISSDCMYGPREILAPSSLYSVQTKTIVYCEYGLLVPVDNDTAISAEPELSQAEQMLAQAIIELHTDKELQKHYREASVSGLKRFAIDEIVNQWINVIDHR